MKITDILITLKKVNEGDKSPNSKIIDMHGDEWSCTGPLYPRDLKLMHDISKLVKEYGS